MSSAQKKLVDLEEEKKKLLEKYGTLSDEEVENRKREQNEAKNKYTRDIQEIEKNLLNLLEKEHPLLDEDGNVVAWVRDIRFFKLLDMLPEELFEGTLFNDNDPKEAVKNLKKQSEYTLKLYEELITVPKKDAEWWREHVTPAFSKLFDKYLEKIISEARDSISFF